MQNIFKKFFDKNLAFIKPVAGSAVGIDIGASAIKVVEIKRKDGKAVLGTYGSLALGPYADLSVGAVTNVSPEIIAQALKDVLHESGITIGSAGIAMPSASSLIFLIDVPAVVTDEELPTIVPTEARKYIPVPVSEVTLDYSLIPRRASAKPTTPNTLQTQRIEMEVEKSEVLVVAVNNDTIEKYTDIAKKAQVNPTFLEIEVFSSIRSSFGHNKETVLMVDMGASKTKLTIVENSIVRNFHVVNRGGFDITNALANALAIPFEKAEQLKREHGLYGTSGDARSAEVIKASMDYIISEIKTVVYTYEKKYNQTLSQVIFTGGGALTKGFLEYAKTAFSTEVVCALPFEKVTAPAFLAPVLSSSGPEFSVALGIALRGLE